MSRWSSLLPAYAGTEVRGQRSEVGGRRAEVRVKLAVYDLLGRVVATLVDEVKPAGSYNVRWNAANQPSGVYFYRLEAGGFVETKKLVLLR